MESERERAFDAIRDERNEAEKSTDIFNDPGYRPTEADYERAKVLCDAILYRIKNDEYLDCTWIGELELIARIHNRFGKRDAYFGEHRCRLPSSEF